jgi:hypothetical protein
MRTIVIYLLVSFFKHERTTPNDITESGKIRENRIAEPYGGDSIELRKSKSMRREVSCKSVR